MKEKTWVRIISGDYRNEIGFVDKRFTSDRFRVFVDSVDKLYVGLKRAEITRLSPRERRRYLAAQREYAPFLPAVVMRAENIKQYKKAA